MSSPAAHRSNVSLALAQREAAWLAPYAMHSEESRGRRHREPAHPLRGPFEIDRDRIVRSAACRRLSCKTQVFTGEMGDYPRTRLTHTLEVCSIARRLGRALRLNEDLIEALALTHDLGHPPFGHAGEAVLDECLAEVGGFCHNRHALRIVEELERCDRRFAGLNLSIEVLEGQQSRIDRRAGEAVPLEIQVVEAADSVTYDTHDADDALELRLLELDELLEVPLWAEAARRVRQAYSDLTRGELRLAILQELVDWQLDDLLRGAQAKLAGIESQDEARQAGVTLHASPEVAEQKADLEIFLHDRVYRHHQVMRMRSRAQSILREMFHFLAARPDLLPESFRQRALLLGVERGVGDYLAGMTDRYAQQQYERLGAGRD